MPAPQAGRAPSAWGVQPGLLEVEELRLANAQLLHLLHLGLQLRRRLLALAFAGLRLRGEIHRHGVGPTLMTHRHTADDIGTEGSPRRGVLTHELPRPLRVAAPALHNLDKAGRVRVAGHINGDVAAVLEAGLPGEQLGGLGPPSVERCPDLPGVGHLSLNHLNKHHGLLCWRTTPLWPRVRLRPYDLPVPGS